MKKQPAFKTSPMYPFKGLGRAVKRMREKGANSLVLTEAIRVSHPALQRVTCTTA